MKPIIQKEVAQFRSDTPGTKKWIHFNNAGTAFPPQQVVKPMLAYLQEESIYGGYELEELYLEKLAATQTLGAEFLNCRPCEIAFAGSATLGWRTVFNGLRFSPGDEILTSMPEYGSNNLAFLQQMQENGVIVRVVPNDGEGQISVYALRAMLNERTKLVSLSHVPSGNGVVQPAAEVGKLTRQAGVLYLLDACQSAGQMPLDVEELGCDMLTLTGRKYMRAPRGTGMLYVREAVQHQIHPPFLDLRSATLLSDTTFQVKGGATRFEMYEHNRALQLGFNQAMQYAMEIGLDRIWNRVEKLGNLLRKGLNTIKGVTVLDQGPVQSGIVTFVRKGTNNAAEKKRLHKRGINVSLSPKGSTFGLMDAMGLDTALRASVHYYNTEAEIERFLEVLQN